MEYYLNGTKLQNGQPFTVGDLTYPWSYLEILSPTQLASMGITAIKPSVAFDAKYYWDVDLPKDLEDIEEVDPVDGSELYVQTWDPTVDNGEGFAPGAMVNTDKRLVRRGLKTICTTEVKTTAGNLLSKTDWYVYRLAEHGTEIPTNIAEQRAAIVAEANRLETSIAAAVDVEELISIMSTQNWETV